jgi:hypothetical protein
LEPAALETVATVLTVESQLAVLLMSTTFWSL